MTGRHGGERHCTSCLVEILANTPMESNCTYGWDKYEEEAVMIAKCKNIPVGSLHDSATLRSLLRGFL